MIVFTTPLPGWGMCGSGSVFGACRTSGSDPCGRRHAGNDLCAPTGTTILAIAPGKVIFSGYRNSSAGYGVIIEHRDIETDQRYESRYYHCPADGLLVPKGRWVAGGQPIAQVGETGNAEGPHLHYELREGGRWGVPSDEAVPIDPYPRVTPLIRRGDRHPYVKAVKADLAVLGFRRGIRWWDDKAGGRFVQQVKAFQEAARITVDGIVGPVTLFEIRRKV